MQKYSIPISRNKRRVTIIRDSSLISEEIEKYNASKYLRNLLLRKDEPNEEELEKQRLEEERKKAEEEERLEDEKRKARLQELKAKEKTQTKFYQEFVVSNENKLVQIDLSNLREDSIPLSIAKEQIQRAYEDGMDDGQISAMSTYKTEIAKYQDWVRRFDATAIELGEKQIESINKIEKTIIDLAILISEEILQKEIEKDENIVINQVRKAIESIRAESIFKIDINPEAYQLLKEVKSELIEEYQLNEDIKIHPNPTVPIGSCLLETSAGLIDARIKNQLGKIKSELIEEENRSIQTEEMQKELNEFYNQKSKKEEIDKFEPLEPESDDEIDIEDLNYEDIPDEYKEMFSEDIFGTEEMDADGNIIKEEKEDEQVEPSEIDYKNLDQDLDEEQLDQENESDSTADKSTEENQDNEISDDDIYLSDDEKRNNYEDLDRDFDDLFDN